MTRRLVNVLDQPAMTPTEPVAEAGGEFVLVPREPTKAMIQASFDSMKPYKFRELTKRKKVQARWAAMLAAAPAPAGDGEAEKLAQIIVDQALKEGFREHFGLGDIKLVADQAARIYLRAQPPQPTGDVGELWAELQQARRLIGEDGKADPSSAIALAQLKLDKASAALLSLNSRTNELTKERDEWRQCAGVEAGLRREFLARAEKAEHLAEQRKGKKETIATARNRALNGLEHFKARVAELEKALRWAFPLANRTLEKVRLERIACGHTMTFEWKGVGKVVGLYQHEWDHREEAFAALSPTEPAGRENGR